MKGTVLLGCLGAAWVEAMPFWGRAGTDLVGFGFPWMCAANKAARCPPALAPMASGRPGNQQTNRKDSSQQKMQ